jgi:hypothetical protein
VAKKAFGKRALLLDENKLARAEHSEQSSTVYEIDCDWHGESDKLQRPRLSVERAW